MEPAVRRVAVFLRAYGAEREALQRRAFAVVGHAVDDGVAWTAVGAGREGVAVAVGGGIKDFCAAVRTHGQVGRDLDLLCARLMAIDDLE